MKPQFGRSDINISDKSPSALTHFVYFKNKRASNIGPLKRGPFLAYADFTLQEEGFKRQSRTYSRGDSLSQEYLNIVQYSVLAIRLVLTSLMASYI